MHADYEFELVVVEAEHDYFTPIGMMGSDVSVRQPDKYLNFTPKIGIVKEFNAGVDAATGDYIVHTGSDVIAPPHWDTELLRLFDDYTDCGVASLSAFEPGWIIGPPQPLDMVVEGMYSPFMMWRKGWRLDEAYKRVYPDSDLVMRMYDQGLHAYRTCRAHVHHLLRMTNDRVEFAEHNRQLALDEGLFYQRWGKSPRAIFGLIRSGQWTYGREYEAFTRPINLHQ